MKNTMALVALSLSVLAIVLSGITFFNLRNPGCRAAYNDCVIDCGMIRDLELLKTGPERSLITVQLHQALRDCTAQHPGDPDGRQRCQDEKRAAAEPKLAALDARDNAAREAYAACVSECRREALDCDDDLVIPDRFHIDSIQVPDSVRRF